ncbi:MAG: hypothetical protein LBT40_03625 [Deltaproteobacteria bacterium]|jgi:hypothetical protein|nr:hypothetical protein [Deltaproteobacteria bacterium]
MADDTTGNARGNSPDGRSLPAGRRRFASCGPADPALHFTVPAEKRLPEIARALAEGAAYAIAPKAMSGRTTHMASLASALNRGGEALALLMPLEAAASAEDHDEFRRLFVARLREALAESPEEELRSATFADEAPDPRLFLKPALSSLCASLPKPLALFLDDLETLPNYFLLSLLHQFRDAWSGRSAYPFPRSFVLCGAAAARELAPAPEAGLTGPRPLVTLPALPLEIPPFEREEAGWLLAEHTREGGRSYTEDAVDEAAYWSGGSPAALCALARTVEEDVLAGDPSAEADGGDFDRAAALVLARREAGIAHALRALEIPGVASAFEAMILGEPGLPAGVSTDDLRRGAEAGLVRLGGGDCAPASPLLRDAAADEAGGRLAYGMPRSVENRLAEGRELDMSAVLKAFQGYWQVKGSRVAPPFGMKGALGHLALMAFLQKVTADGGEVLREYGLGRGRLDLLVRFRGSVFPVGAVTNESEALLKESLLQMTRYVDRLRTRTGWLVAFDPDPSVGWERKLFWRSDKHEGRTVHVVGA